VRDNGSVHLFVPTTDFHQIHEIEIAAWRSI
jgi:hypothetical protein